MWSFKIVIAVYHLDFGGSLAAMLASGHLTAGNIVVLFLNASGVFVHDGRLFLAARHVE